MVTRFRNNNISTQELNRRRFLKGVTAAAGMTSLVPLLDACGGSSAPSGPVSLRFQVLPDQNEANNAKAFIAAFNKKYPDIHVKVEELSGGDYHQKLLLQTSSNTLPDLFWIEDQSVTTYAAKGTMLKLDTYIKQTGYQTSDIYPSMLQLGQYNGSQYMLPRDYNHLVTFYNIDMFKAAGVSLPQDGWTWDDFVSAAQKLTKKDASGKTTQFGIDGGNFNWWAVVIPAIRGFGGDVINSSGKSMVNSPEAIKAIEALNQLVKGGVATNFATSPSQSFSTNQCAMVLHVRPLVGTYKAASQGKFTWNAATFPKFPVNHRVGTGASGYSISAKTAHPDEAWKLLSFIDSADGQKIFEATGNSVPVLKSLQNDPAWLLPNLNNKAFTAFPEADTLPLEIQLPAGAGGSIYSNLATLLQEVFLGKKTSQQMIQQWDQQINQSIADAKS